MNSAFKKGFSLLELLLVVAILAIAAVMSVGYYRNYVKSVELESAAKLIAADLRTARSKAMLGDGSLKWGVNFVNSSTDYHELFSTPTDYQNASTSVQTTTYLLSGINFTVPPSASATNVIFNKITGAAASTSVTISFENNSQNINVSANGTIY